MIILNNPPSEGVYLRMKLFVYSTKEFEKPYLENANTPGIDVTYTSERLFEDTVNLSSGYDTISIFTADDASTPVLKKLFLNGTKHIAIRAAGYDNVNLETASRLGIQVANVPEYSPYAIAEMGVALLLALNRKINIADQQFHKHNFTLDNLVGFDLNGKTFGIIGTGRIGAVLAKLMHGFGCRLLGYDIVETPELVQQYNLKYVTLEQLCMKSDIISLNTSLNEQTKYLLNRSTFAQMKDGVIIINTGRGGCINTMDLIEYTENGKIGGYGADVYENEKGLYFKDWGSMPIKDKLLEKLMTLPNVLLTPHQGFATNEALTNIATTTFETIAAWKKNMTSAHELTSLAVQPA